MKDTLEEDIDIICCDILSMNKISRSVIDRAFLFWQWTINWIKAKNTGYF